MLSRAAIIVALALAVILVVGLGGPAVDTTPDRPIDTSEATVTFTDEDGSTLGVVNVAVADTDTERYEGLSNTQPLEPDTGMLFVFESEANRTFVMREMNYPIDMIFVSADGKVTAIHHAEVEEDDDPGDDLTPYSGRAKWVVEVPFEWTIEHGVEVGDSMNVNRTSNGG